MTFKEQNIFLYFAAFNVNLVALSAGTTITWSSPMLPKLNGNVDPNRNPLGRSLTLVEESWIASILLLGAMFGAVVSGQAANKLGRKKILICLAKPIFLSYLIMAFANNVTLFLIARFIGGVGVGSVFCIVPMYLAEIAENYNRGVFGCLFSVSVAGGQLFSYVFGPFLSIQNFCFLCLLPLVLFFPLFVLVNPESPHFFATVNNYDQMKISLTKLRRKKIEDVENEMVDISKMVEDLSRNKPTLKNFIVVKTLRKGLIISVGLVVYQQMGGLSAILAYMQIIFDATGSNITPEISAIIIGVVQLIIISISSSLVDRIGRRILLLSSATGCCLFLTFLGICYFLFNYDQSLVKTVSWLPVLCLIFYIIFLNIGLGPLPWAVMAEVFAPNVKFVASTITSIAVFISSFITSGLFPLLTVNLGMAGTFWLFAVICASGTIFVYFVVPETKGKTLREIQSLLE